MNREARIVVAFGCAVIFAVFWTLVIYTSGVEFGEERALARVTRRNR